MKGLKIDTEKVREKLVRFIKDEFKNAGFNRAVIGVSGGVDSALSAALCCRALGNANVFGLILPYGKDSRDVGFAKMAADSLKINCEVIDISPMVDAYFKTNPEADKIRRGNKMARERMSILYDRSKVLDALVVGTGNKTETLLGYCTLHGDSACAINPVSGLYKTQVRELTKAFGLPKEIVERKPSAGLWDGQTDEDELGYMYEDIDKLLYCMVEEKSSKKKLISKGFDAKFIDDIAEKIEKTAFKRQLPRTIQI